MDYFRGYLDVPGVSEAVRDQWLVYKMGYN